MDISWIKDNVEVVSLVLSAISIFITSILTFLILSQTKKINIQQMEFESSITKRQEELQKRQIHLESFPYKREIYSHVFTIFELCHQFLELSKSVDLYSKEPEKLKGLLDGLQKSYIPDNRKTMWSLREAEYILPRNISEVLLDVRKNYDSMCANLIYLDHFSKIMTENELINEFESIKKISIDNALDCCRSIDNHAQFIERIMPEELSISNISK